MGILRRKTKIDQIKSKPVSTFNFRLSTFLFVIFSALSCSVFSQNTATVFGRIIDAQKNPIEDVTVSVFGGSQRPVYTDKYGKFEYVIPAGESIVLVFSKPGVKQMRDSVKLEPGQRYEMNRSLRLETLIGVEIVDQNRVQPMKRLDPKVVSYIPTASGDFNAILFSQPGVSSRNELSSSYSVRGGNFDENLVYVNGIEVYRPFLVRSGQQEGLSFINPDMVSSVLFSAGGFEAKYGDKMSSVLDIQYRRPHKFAGTVSGSLLGSNVHLEGCTPNYRFTWLLGARYKTSRYVLSSLDTRGDYKPSFADVQTYLTFDITDEWELDFLGNYARNQYSVIPENRETDFGTVNKALRLQIYFDGQEADKYDTYSGALSLIYHPNERVNMKFITSAFRTFENESFDIQGQYYIDELENDFGKATFGQVKNNLGVGTFLSHARNDLDALVFSEEYKGTYLKGKNQLLWGARWQYESVNDKLSEWKYVDSAGFSLPQNPPYTIDLQDVIKTKHVLASNRIMGYVEDIWSTRLKDTSEITVTAGLRANYWNLNGETVLSPRVTFAYKPNWKKDFLFRASSGYYYQPPFYRELRDLNGVVHTDVNAQKSVHFLLGSDLNFKAWDRPFKFVAEAYYKHLDNLIPYEIDNVRIRYYAENSAKGHAKGIDMKVNGEFVNGIESWASIGILSTKEDIKNDFYYDYYNSDGDKIIKGYTFNNKAVDSVRFEPGAIPRPTDQRINFGLFFQDYIPKFPDFKMHLSLLFGTSVPFGPPDFAKYKDTLRMPPYRRVDIGFSYALVKEEKKLPEHNPFKFLKSVWLSLEVFNLLQTNNTVSYLWVKDATGRQYAIPNYLTARQLNFRMMIKF